MWNGNSDVNDYGHNNGSDNGKANFWRLHNGNIINNIIITNTFINILPPFQKLS